MEAAGGGGGAAAGATCTGAGAGAGVRLGFGAGFLAAASTGAVVGVGDEALAAEAGARGAGGVADEPGSGVMMLTAGVEAAVGNSALVGLPVGIEGESAATGAVAAGAFHDGA